MTGGAKALETKASSFQQLRARFSAKAAKETPSKIVAGPIDYADETDASNRIWAKAYAHLKEKEEDLMKVYEKVLHEQAHKNPKTALASAALAVGGLVSNVRVHSAAHMASLRRDLDGVAQSANTRAERYAKLEKGVKMTAEVLGKLEKTVEAALTAYPLAGIAWSGLCAAAPYATQVLTARAEMREGLEYVVDELAWYMDLARVLLRANWKTDAEFARFQATLEGHVVRLYAKLVRFQVHVVVEVFDKNPLVRALKVLAGFTDWKAETEELKALKAVVDQRFGDGVKLEVVNQLRSMASTMQHMDSTMQHMDSIMQHDSERAAENARQRAREKHSKLIGTFATIDYQAVMWMNPQPVNGTCMWFTRNDQFQSWLDDEDSGVFLVSANPGCGKSVLSRYLVESFLPRRKPKSTICYFFFKDNLRAEHKNPAFAVCSVLHRLFQQQPQVVDSCAVAVDRAGDSVQSNLTALWDIFGRAVASEEAGSIIVVLDALDECDPAGLQLLMENVDAMLRQRKAEGQPRYQVKFLLTARGYPQILDLIDNLGSLKVRLSVEDGENSEQIQEEIKLVVRYQLDRLKSPPRKLSEDKVRAIESSIWRKGEVLHTYLWVKLVFQALEKQAGRSLDGLATVAEKLPPGLWGVYETLLEDVSGDDLQRVQTLLRLIIAAKRPLKLAELQVALKVRHRIGAKNETALRLVSDREFQGWITSACGFLLSVHDRRVYFLHLTAKEFLMSYSSEPGSIVIGSAANKASWAHSISEREAEAAMAESCVAYLSLRHFSGSFFTSLAERAFTHEGYYGENYSRTEGRASPIPVEIAAGDGYMDSNLKADQDHILSKYVFLQYVCTHWHTHFRDAQRIEEGTGMVQDIEPRYYEPYLRLFDGGEYWCKRPWVRIVLHCIIEAGQFDLVREEAMRFDRPSDFAAYFGHLRLLQAAAALPPPGPGNSDALASAEIEPANLAKNVTNWIHWAAFGGASACIQYLKRFGFQKPYLPLSGRSPLVWAAAQGHLEALELLIDEDTLQHQDKDGYNPLLAILSPHTFRGMLLDRPQHIARIRPAIRLLVTRGVNVKAADIHGNTALHLLPSDIDEADPDVDAAVLSPELQKLYPKATADPRHHAHGKRPKKGKKHALVVPRIDVPPEDVGPEPAYQSRAFFRSEEFLDLYDGSMLKSLVERGASVHAANDRGETPLHLYSGHRIVARHPWNLLFLLHEGAEKEVKDNRGQTPLFYAVREEQVLAVRVLLAHGARPDQRENGLNAGPPLERTYGWTPLHYVAYVDYHFAAMTHDLLAHGADPNARSADGGTVLHLLAERRRPSDSMVRMFTQAQKLGPAGEAGCFVDVEVLDNNGWTALHLAAFHGNMPMVQGLLGEGGAGAKPNTKTPRKKNKHGEREQSTKESDQEGKGEQTALHLTILGRNFPIFVRTLLDYGAEPDALNGEKRTPLHLLCMQRPSESSTLTKDNQREIAELLLKRGTSARVPDEDGKTPLDMARDMGLDHLSDVIQGRILANEAAKSDTP